MEPSHDFASQRICLCSSNDQPNSATWTWEENKLFEDSVVEFKLDSPNFFARIASRISGKTIEEIKQHHENLVEDLNNVNMGRIQLPNYKTINIPDEEKGESSNSKVQKKYKKKKSIRWTKEEHRRFLNGLEEYEKGDWKSISRMYVQTKTPPQVASHAQKYFIKLKKEQGDIAR